MARVMREQAVKIKSRHKNFIDIAGTGSSRRKLLTFRPPPHLSSPARDLTVAKHGNRAVTSKTGSADVLEKLGVKVSGEPEIAQKCLNGAGICFMFAPKFHPTSAARRRYSPQSRHPKFSQSARTVLSNPANAPKQIIGVWHKVAGRSRWRKLWRCSERNARGSFTAPTVWTK